MIEGHKKDASYGRLRWIVPNIKGTNRTLIEINVF